MQSRRPSRWLRPSPSLTPQANSIGGDNFWLIAEANASRPRALNGSGWSGTLATPEHYKDLGYSAIPARGPLAANIVPGTVSAWHQAFEFSRDALHGTIPWKELLADAIGYARDGIPVSLHQEVRGPIDFALDDKDFGNIQRFPQTRKAFCHPDGRPLRRGEVMRQQDLAQTLEQIAREGADAFYKGDIAKRLVTTLKPEGGVFTTEDFSAYQAEWVEPISVAYRDRVAFNLPPNSQGMAALEILNILNNFDIASIEDGSTEFFHLMAEATKAAFADRDEWLTDPKFLEIPLDRLLSAEHGREHAERIRAAGKAAFSNPAVQGGGHRLDRRRRQSRKRRLAYSKHLRRLRVRSRCWRHRRAHAEPWKVLQTRLDIAKSVGAAQTVFPHVGRGNDVRENSLELVYGSMGGEGQPQNLTALVARIIDHGLDPQEAIEAPRWLQGRMLDLSQPGSQLNLEGRVRDKVVHELRPVRPPRLPND